MRAGVLKQETIIKKDAVSSQLMPLCKKGIIDEWLYNTDNAKNEISTKLNEAMKRIEKFEQDAKEFLNNNN